MPKELNSIKKKNTTGLVSASGVQLSSTTRLVLEVKKHTTHTHAGGKTENSPHAVQSYLKPGVIYPSSVDTLK